MEHLFLDLICVALGTRVDLARKPTEREWIQIFDLAMKQTVVGICFVGVQTLRKNHSENVQNMPQSLFLQWLAIAAKVQQRNELMDKLSARLWNTLEAAGLKAVLLKGQGVALNYGELAKYRQSGDIDVWVKGGFDVVNKYVQSTFPSDDFSYHRFHYGVFKETEVELHFRPTLMRNFFDDRKLQRWCDSFSSTSFVMTEKGFAVPPTEFNRVFILTHIYRHFLFEGVGLRQVMDLFYVLKQEKTSEEDKIKAMSVFSDLNMARFAGAVMWVLHECLGLSEDYLICRPNEKEGSFLLSEIMSTGNFGQGDVRYKGNSKLKMMTRHGLHLLRHYPSEVIWTPIWLVYHRIWKINKKRNLVENE